jgi:hypothetical protein
VSDDGAKEAVGHDVVGERSLTATDPHLGANQWVNEDVTR